MLNRLGSTIRQLRHDRDVSQQELAGAAGITASFMSLIEHGHRVPSLRVIDRIAKGLGISREALLWESVEIPKGITDEDRKLCEFAKSIVRRSMNGPEAAQPDQTASA